MKTSGQSLRVVGLLTVLCLVWPVVAQAGRLITDSAGRQVEIPDHVERVIAAGPPASALVYVLAPEKLIGWNRKPSTEELAYLSPSVANRPEIGRLTGRGGSANVEVVLGAKPDLIVDYGSVTETYVSLADRVQSQTGIPYFLIDGRFAKTPEALRLLGTIFGTTERAEKLATRMEEIFAETDRAVAGVPADKRPRVYLARTARGLETGNRGSIHTEVVERAGGVNVVDAGLERGGLYNVSVEQVLAWNPDTIITLDRNFFDSVRTIPGWSATEALGKGRVFLSPRLPYGWVDAPPSINRLMGLQWLSRLFFPERFKDDVRTVTRDFYATFYQVQLTDAALDRLLQDAQPAR